MHAEPREPTQDLTPLNVIRSETVLSRYPVHRLAKRGHVSIEIRRQGDGGEVTVKWEVSHNSRHGQPGPLAYKLDTLVINRRIEEAGRPLPEVICLGSLREVCEELGLHESGQNIAHLKRALRQNAFAAITAKIKYKGLDGAERSVEINDTRYGVIFTGERLPDGRRADAVFIVLHEFYRGVLNNTPTRPLDYDYLKGLAPGPQRFYELISYQVYAALKHRRPRARYLYSEYCAYAPQTRYFDYEHVKKQMYKVHAPHRRSDYLALVELEATTDGEGRPDWIMFYTPGRKAKAEHEAFSRKQQVVEPAIQQRRAAVNQRLLPAPQQLAVEAAPEVGALVRQLKSLGVSEVKAGKLVAERREAVERQLLALPYRDNKGAGRKNPAGWIIAAIEQDYELPPAYAGAATDKHDVSGAHARRLALDACNLCDSSGLRYMGRKGGVRKCSHDPKIEAKYER